MNGRTPVLWLTTIAVTLGYLFALNSNSLGAGINAGPIREQKTVLVDGVKEIWQLRWQSRPKRICGATDAETSLTCPCSGFAYGEEGRLSLVRLRPPGPRETLDLGPLFANEYPASNGNAVVQKWPPHMDSTDNDFKHANDRDFERQVQKRPSVDLMQFADYDHDGRATEFLIQVATQPCGKHQMVLVGISLSNPNLHAFATVEKPDKPLVLSSWEWEALRDSSGKTTVIDWNCDDHGSDMEHRVALDADSGAIHAKQLKYSCPRDGSAKQLLEIMDR